MTLQEAQGVSGVQVVYNFSIKQATILDSLRALRIAIAAQPPSSDTKTLLLDTYDTLLEQLALDVGNSIIKPELQKDIT